MKTSDFIYEYRARALEAFNKAPEPSFKHGLNIDIRPQNIDWKRIDGRDLVINTSVEGVSSGLFRVSSLALDAELLETGELELFFDDRWMHSSFDPKLFAMQQAFGNQYLLLKIPEGRDLASTIHVKIKAEQGNMFSTVLILAEANAQAKVVLSVEGGQSEQMLSSDVRIIQKDSSRVTFVVADQISEQDTVFRYQQAHLEKDAKIEWLNMSLTGSFDQTSVINYLDGSGAEGDITALYLLGDNQRHHIYTDSTHRGRSTQSNIITRGVIGGKAKALSRGMVRIEENAFGSNGYEKQDALLLSEKAEADAIPNLEIHNHDVKCSHGSTVGQIDAGKLFYLMSRGLSKKQAIAEIVTGYFAPVLEVIADEAISKRIEESVETSLREVDSR